MIPRPLPYQGFHPKRQHNFDWSEFREFVYGKYAKSTAPKVMSYAKRYCHLLNSGNIYEIERISATVRNDVIKALIILSKYLGVHEEFKAALKNHGIKLIRPDAFASFTRMYTNRNSNLWKWYAEVEAFLKPEERLLLEYLRFSGLRKEEGIISFNMIIELAKQNKLANYLDEDGLLEHFKFRKQFLRCTKNVFISIVPITLIDKITASRHVAYNPLFKRLRRRKMRCRINELRDQYGSFMVRHGLTKEEVDLLQGRIPPSIFIRHYWSPSFTELKERVLEALVTMVQETKVDSI